MSTSLSSSNRTRAASTLLTAAALCAAFAVPNLYAADGGANASSFGIMVLDTGDITGALTLNGNARAIAPVVYVNSTSASAAIRGNGNTVLDAPVLNLVGGANFNGGATCTGVISNFPNPVLDPFATTPTPAADTSHDLGTVSAKSGAVTLSPGYYSGGISVRNSAVVTLSPGTYILGNDFAVTGGTITGTGVTIVMLRGHMSMSGQATETLSAPTTGAYAGMVIAQPASNTSSMSLAGGSTMVLSGSIWAPAAAATITGNASAEETGPQMGDSLFVKTLTISGTGKLRVGQPNTSVVPPQVNNLHD